MKNQYLVKGDCLKRSLGQFTGALIPQCPLCNGSTIPSSICKFLLTASENIHIVIYHNVLAFLTNISHCISPNLRSASQKDLQSVAYLHIQDTVGKERTNIHSKSWNYGWPFTSNITPLYCIIYLHTFYLIWHFIQNMCSLFFFLDGK